MSASCCIILRRVCELPTALLDDRAGAGGDLRLPDFGPLHR